MVYSLLESYYHRQQVTAIIIHGFAFDNSKLDIAKKYIGEEFSSEFMSLNSLFETDFIVLHPKNGIFIFEVKNRKIDFSKSGDTFPSVIRKALDQLNVCEAFLRQLLLHIRRVDRELKSSFVPLRKILVLPSEVKGDYEQWIEKRSHGAKPLNETLNDTRLVFQDEKLNTSTTADQEMWIREIFDPTGTESLLCMV